MVSISGSVENMHYFKAGNIADYYTILKPSNRSLHVLIHTYQYHKGSIKVNISNALVLLSDNSVTERSWFHPNIERKE